MSIKSHKSSCTFQERSRNNAGSQMLRSMELRELRELWVVHVDLHEDKGLGGVWEGRGELEVKGLVGSHSII